MDWPLLEDAANLVVRDVFGEPVSYRSAAGVVTPVTGVYSEEYEEVLPDGGASVVSAQPNLLLRLADLPSAPTEGDNFTVRGRTYRVEQAPHVDGTGTARLLGKRTA